VRYVQTLGIGALALGLAAPFAGSPLRTSTAGADLDAIARAIDEGSDHVSARELAEWIRDRRPGLRVIDVRSPAEFGDDAIPTAENLPIDRLLKTRFASDETVVLYSQEGAHAGQAWVMLRALGVKRVVFVPGGLADWNEEVLHPVLSSSATVAERERIAELSHFFGGSPRIDDIAARADGDSGRRQPLVRRRGC